MLDSIQNLLAEATIYARATVPANEKLKEVIVTKCAVDALTTNKPDNPSKVTQYVAIATGAASISMATECKLLRDIAKLVSIFFLLSAARRALNEGD